MSESPDTRLLDDRIRGQLEELLAAAERRRFGGGGGSGDGLEARVARVESDIESIKDHLREVRSDLREIKSEARLDFRLLFGALIAVALGLAGVMAKGFGWF